MGSSTSLASHINSHANSQHLGAKAMTSATSSAATSTHRNTAAPRTVPNRPQMERPRHLTMGTEEAAVLKLDLSDLSLPQVGGLQVDGFKPSFFERLFGKR
jgi:hypothetical protein